MCMNPAQRSGIAAAFVLALSLGATAEDKRPDAPEIRVLTEADGKVSAFEAARLPANLRDQLAASSREDDVAKVFAVFVVDPAVASDAKAADRIPMLGSYATKDGSLRFAPRYPLRPGLTYQAVLRLDGGSVAAARLPASGVVTHDVKVPDVVAPPTEIAQVFPSDSIVPENLLRIYLHFSAPMSRGDVYRHTRILDETGKPVHQPFLALGEELWDPSGRRLTLLLDPGRIKKGLSPRLEHGPILVAGRKYTLVVDRDMRDALGRPLKADVRKEFRAGPAIEQAIDQTRWKFEPPRAGSQGPLVVRLPYSLDQPLLLRMLTVKGPDGKPLAGETSLADAERTWQFRPHAAWPAGQCGLVVDTDLEDLCGNRIGKPFEVDTWEQVKRQVVPEFIEIPVTPVVAGQLNAAAGK